jgi:hypothetical protein
VLSWNNIYIFFNFTYPLRCLRVSPGVRVPQVEYHWSRQTEVAGCQSLRASEQGYSPSWLFLLCTTAYALEQCHQLHSYHNYINERVVYFRWPAFSWYANQLHGVHLWFFLQPILNIWAKELLDSHKYSRLSACFSHILLSMKYIENACYLLHAGFLLGLLFDPEDWGDMFLSKVGWLPTDCMAVYPRG